MSHATINVKQANALYDRLKTWPRVAVVMKRKNGTKFTTQAIQAAVCRANKGRATWRQT